MDTYISLLRGINVSGKNIIKMDSLREMYQDAGFHNVRSYMQSGNVLFEYAETPPAELADTISEAIEATFGYQVPVVIRTAKDLSNIYDANPFGDRPEIDPKRLGVVFLDRPPDKPIVPADIPDKVGTDEFVFVNKEIYTYCPNGFGKSKLTNAVWEKKLSRHTTARNWNTVIKLLELAARTE